jgi:hypothetical protein
MVSKATFCQNVCVGNADRVFMTVDFIFSRMALQVVGEINPNKIEHLQSVLPTFDKINTDYFRFWGDI